MNVFAKVLSPTRILLVTTIGWNSFVDSGNLANYALTTVGGSPLVISSATVNGFTGVTLDLAAPLVPDNYFLSVDPSVFLLGPVPFTSYLFALPYFPKPLDVSVPMAAFSGEVTGGPLGNPAGQVFFSPALQGPSPSEIKLDNLETCVDLVDTYTFPSPPDPKQFYLTQAFDPGLLNNTLFTLAGAHATAYTEFEVGLALLEEDTLGAMTDGPATGLLVEAFDPTKVSLLNVSYWTLEGTGTEPHPFICSDTTAPIPPGATVGPFPIP